MASSTDRLEIERRLTAQLIRLNSRIEKMQKEKQSLEALIIAHRAGYLPQKGALRKNAVAKTTTQMQILEIIRSAKRPISTQEILEKLQNRIIDLNESTFRSYIFRLKSEGIIEIKGQRGFYILTQPDSEPVVPKRTRKIVIRRPGAIPRGDK